ncbi:MAG: hypothetical protein LBS19_09050 [Clostridiales bacterium]|jgi:hypothetical protein|nr:hypothetical protein [Clostridiales bacterium]
MPLVKNFEKKVFDVEGFKIRIMDNGVNVRGDKEIPNQYSFEKKCPGNQTVFEWRTNRFSKFLAGYDVDVLYSDENIAIGQTTLKTVRETYI